MSNPPSCQLIHSGKKELQRLLNIFLADGYKLKQYKARSKDRIWKRSVLAQLVGMSPETIEKIVVAAEPVDHPDPDDYGKPVSEESLAKLFVTLQELASYSQSKRENFIEKASTLASTQDTSKMGIVPTEQKQKTLVEEMIKQEGSKILEVRWWKTYTKTEKKYSDPEGIVSLLRYLDYRDQQGQFDDKLTESDVVAFLLNAPCEVSQQWVIDRLSHSINNTLLITSINVANHPIRDQGVNSLWKEVQNAITTGSKPSTGVSHKEKVIQQLSKGNPKRTVVIALYNFENEDIENEDTAIENEDIAITPYNIIQHFWIPLTQEILPKSRPNCPRIILLIADNKDDQQLDEELKALKPLNSITPLDIRRWFNAKGRDWAQQNLDEAEFIKLDDSIASGARWKKSKKPGKALDNLCFDLGLKNGIQDLRKQWR